MFVLGPLVLVFLILIAFAVWAVAHQQASGAILLRIVAGAIGVGLVGLLFAALWLFESTRESVTLKESVRYERLSTSTTESDRSPPARKSDRSVEFIPTPSDNSTSTSAESPIPPAEASADDSVAPAWIGLADTASAGDTSTVVSDGPRPSQRECREQIRSEITASILRYARTHDMLPLARRPELLPENIFEQLVQQTYFKKSPQQFGGEEQMWYILYQQLEFNAEIQQQLLTLNNRALADERLVVLGASGVGLLGLLSLALVVLKFTANKKQPQSATAESTEWTLK